MNFRLLIVISFFSVLLSDVLYYLSASMHLSLDVTYIITLLRLVSLICLLIFNVKFEWGARMPPWARIFFKWMIIWNIANLVKGALTATDYWDWKYLFLNATFSMTIPYAIIVGILFTYSEDLFALIVTRLFVFGYLVIPLTLSLDPERELFPRAIMITSSFFTLLIPYVKPKWRIAILCIGITSVLLAYDFRSNVLRIAFALLLAGAFYLRRFIPLALFKAACIALILTPVVFFVLGVTGQFNIFKPPDDVDKYAISYENGGPESNLATDTRTFLYEEVLQSMKSKNTFLFGEGAIGKYKTAYFDESVIASSGRYGSEVGVLNTLLYSGIIGVLLYASVMFSGIYYGLWYSNNFLTKMMALFLAFRWVIFFIEDYPEYDMNYYFIWVTIGLCLSSDFRRMNDMEIKDFFDFSKKKVWTPKLA